MKNYKKTSSEIMNILDEIETQYVEDEESYFISLAIKRTDLSKEQALRLYKRYKSLSAGAKQARSDYDVLELVAASL